MPGERSEAVPLGPLGDGLPSDLSTGDMGAPAVSEYAGGSPALREPQAIGAVVADLPLVTSQPAAAHRRRRRRRHCPLCHGGVRGRMVDAEDAALCARCVVDIAAGERAWSCQACSFCLCTHCAPLVDPPLIASQDQAPQGIATDITVAGSTPVGGVDANLRAAVAVVSEIVAEHAHSHQDVDAPDIALLVSLRALPIAFPRAPMLWVPRRLKSQVASILKERVAVATRTANAAECDIQAEIAHRLCRAATQLLLRPVASAAEAEQEDGQHQYTQVAKLVR